VDQSEESNLYQLTGEQGLLSGLTSDSEERRGVPPSLVEIIEYAETMDMVDNIQVCEKSFLVPHRTW